MPLTKIQTALTVEYRSRESNQATRNMFHGLMPVDDQLMHPVIEPTCQNRQGQNSLLSTCSILLLSCSHSARFLSRIWARPKQVLIACCRLMRLFSPGSGTPLISGS